MADYSANEIANIMLVLGECRGDLIQTVNRYAELYPNARHPVRSTIRAIVARLRNGHLQRQRRRHEYDDNDNRVILILAMIYLHPYISSSQIQRESGIPKQTVLKI